MIRSLRVVDPKRTPAPWWPKVKGLEGVSELTFQPGLNILWGPNGSGKTTLLTAMARLLFCEQGGVTTYTHAARRELSRGFDDEVAFDGLVVDHDGRAVRYFNPDHKVGLVGGSFDDDFFGKGLMNTIRKASSGQTVMIEVDGLIAEMLSGYVPPITQKAKPSDDDEIGKRMWGLVSGSGEKGPPTLILDEPDRSLDTPKQLAIWKSFRALWADAQIIVSSHSPFALRIEEANYIDLEPGARQKAVAAVEALKDWPTERPKFPDASREKAKEIVAKRNAERERGGGFFDD